MTLESWLSVRNAMAVVIGIVEVLQQLDIVVPADLANVGFLIQTHHFLVKAVACLATFGSRDTVVFLVFVVMLLLHFRL